MNNRPPMENVILAFLFLPFFVFLLLFDPGSEFRLYSESQLLTHTIKKKEKGEKKKKRWWLYVRIRETEIMRRERNWKYIFI